MADNDRDQEELHTTPRETKRGNNDLQQQYGGADKEATKGKGSGRSGQATPGNKGGNQMTGTGTNGISEDDEDLGGRAGQPGSQAGSTPRSGNSGS